MITFDAPDREKCTARRTITNTPLQALVLLNDPPLWKPRASLAERMLTEGGKTPRDASRLRLPARHRPRARSRAKSLYCAIRSTPELLDYKRHEDRAQALLKNGESPVNREARQIGARCLDYGGAA